MSSFQYIGLFFIATCVISAIAYFLNAPPKWIIAGAAVIMAAGIFTSRE